MRRTRALFFAALAALLALSVSVPVSAATVIPATAFIKENFERAPSDEPCVFDDLEGTLTCPGIGNAGRFGKLRSSAVYSDTGVVRTITFLRDGATLTVAETYGDVSFPGNSSNAPGAMRSFGNPFSLTGTWEVVSGTGSLTDAEGSGTVIQMGAGNTLNFWFSGSITLP